MEPTKGPKVVFDSLPIELSLQNNLSRDEQEVSVAASDSTVSKQVTKRGYSRQNRRVLDGFEPSSFHGVRERSRPLSYKTTN